MWKPSNSHGRFVGQRPLDPNVLSPKAMLVRLLLPLLLLSEAASFVLLPASRRILRTVRAQSDEESDVSPFLRRPEASVPVDDAPREARVFEQLVSYPCDFTIKVCCRLGTLEEEKLEVEVLVVLGAYPQPPLASR